MRILFAFAVLLLAGCSTEVMEVEDYRTAPFRRPSSALADSIAPPGLVDVNPPHKPEDPVRN